MEIDKITRKKKVQKQQNVVSGFSISTEVLSASNTTEIITFYFPAEVVSFQGSGDLAGTIEFSLDGVNWKNSTAIPASNAVGSYSLHMATSVKVTRTGGSGKLAVAAK